MKRLVLLFYLVVSLSLNATSQTYFLLDDYTVVNPTGIGNCDGGVIINSLPAGTTNHEIYYQNGAGNLFHSSSDTITGLCEDFYIFTVTDQNNRSFYFVAIIETTSGLPFGFSLDEIVLEPESTVGACDDFFQISSNYGVIGETFTIQDNLGNYYFNSTLATDPGNGASLCIAQDYGIQFELSGYQFSAFNYPDADEYGCLFNSSTSNLVHSSTSTSCNGSIRISPIGGVPPFTVEVSSGDSLNLAFMNDDANIINLCPGNYNYIITDGGGNNTNGFFTINDLSITPDTAKLMTVYYRVINPINPGDCNGALVVDSIINGTPPYYFHLNKSNDPLWMVLPGPAAYNLCDWGYAFEIYDSNCDHVMITAQPEDGNSQYYTRSFQLTLTNESYVGTCDGELELKFFPNLYNGYMTISNYWQNQVYFTGGQITNPATYSNICMNQSEGIAIDLYPNYFDSYRAVNDFAYDGYGQFCQPFVVEKNITPVTALGNCDGEIDLNIYGGHPPYTFEYSNGSTVEDLTGLCAGYYWVKFNDTHWNYKATSFIITDSAHLYENDLTFIPSDTLFSNTFENCDFDYSLPIDTVYLDTAYSTGPNLITTEYIIVQGSNEFIFTESFQYDSLLNYMVIFDFYCTTRSVDGYYSIHVGLPILEIFNGINEIERDHEIQNLSVYPNPFESNYTIEFDLKNEEQITFELTDISGKIISTNNYNCSAGKNKLDFEFFNLSNGLYILRTISENGQSVSKKILKN